MTSSPTLSYSPVQETAPSHDLKFEPGEKFGDRYTIIEEIGRGGMGRVYKAEDHELGTTVVLKMIRPELSSRPGMIDQFRKETLLGRSISQENVVRIHDLGELKGIRYISMDFVKGENLHEFIQTSGTLTLSTCLQIAIQVCQALKAAHQKGIVHQDLKPQNIMIDNSGKVYVTDFGLAKSVSVSRVHRPGKISGTPKYFSPEQARGEESDERSDIYSLGVILYEMVTGTAPYKSDTVDGYIQKHGSEKPPLPSKINPDIPPACEKIILKCLEKKKEDRYQSVGELLKDLELQKKLARGLGVWAHLRKWQKTIVAAVLLLFFGIVIFELYKRIFPAASPPAPSGRIAVMYAVNNSGDKSLNDQFRWIIPYYLNMDLSQSKYLNVLPQDRLMQILSDMKQLNEEHHLSKTLDRISDEANVSYFVLPSFTKVSNNFWISFTVRKAKTDTTVGEPDTVKGQKLEDVLSMVDELSSKVKAKLSLSPTEITGDTNRDLAKITTGSLEAVRYYVEAEKYYVQGDFRASIQVLEKAVKEDPNYAIAYLKMADDCGFLRDYGNRRKYLQMALALSDRVSERDRYQIQGFAAIVLNESPLPAIEIYNKMISLYPDDEHAHTMLGAIYRDHEDWELAMDQFNKALAINPRYSLALENKAYIYASMGRYKEAVELSEARVGSTRDERFFPRLLPLLYLIQGQYDRASAELEKSLVRMPDDLGLFERKGIFYLLSGDVESARRVFEQLQVQGEAVPDTPNLRGRFCLAYLRLLRGEYSQVQKGISEEIEQTQKSGRIYDELDLRLLLGYSELQLKRFSRAAEALKPLLEIAKRTYQLEGQRLALHLLGLASLGMGQTQGAKNIAQQLHQLIEITGFPKSMRHYEHLMGQISLGEGHPDQAIPHYEQAISWLPNQRYIYDEQAFYYDGLAAAYYQSGDFLKAIKIYKGIISLTTGRFQWGDIYARSYYWLGKIYQRTENSSDARAHYESFLKLWENADTGLPEVIDAKKQLEVLGKVP